MKGDLHFAPRLPRGPSAIIGAYGEEICRSQRRSSYKSRAHPGSNHEAMKGHNMEQEQQEHETNTSNGQPNEQPNENRGEETTQKAETQSAGPDGVDTNAVVQEPNQNQNAPKEGAQGQDDKDKQSPQAAQIEAGKQGTHPNQRMAPRIETQEDAKSPAESVHVPTTKAQWPLTDDYRGRLDALPNKSAKIRRMHADGYTTSQIAKTLDILYQHARNVLLQRVKRPTESMQPIPQQPQSQPQPQQQQAPQLDEAYLKTAAETLGIGVEEFKQRLQGKIPHQPEAEQQPQQATAAA
jgi:hypothetical protein